MMNRRQVLAGAAAAGMVLPSLARVVMAASSGGFSRQNYSQAIVIDSLGGIGEAGPDGFSSQLLADLKASGITALNETVGTIGNGPGKFAETVESIDQYDALLAEHSAALMLVRSGADLRKAKASGRFGVIYGFQDTTMLEGDLTRLAMFHERGVRIVQLTYNLRNSMGSGCLAPKDEGVSALGRQCIAEIERLKLLLDLSHAGARTQAEGIAASTRPPAITHTGCRALVDYPRNTHDRELKALADKGGVAGIYFMPFLRKAGQPTAEDLLRHLDHAVKVCGEDHVGLGTDGGVSGEKLDAAAAKAQREFYERRAKEGIAAPGEAADVFNLIPEYNDPGRFLRLAEDLSRRGWPASRIEKILGGNFARLFTEAWG